MKMAKFLDADELREKILSFSLDQCEHGSQGYNRVLLQLFGHTGHGKSSLINSCIYTLSDRGYRNYAQTGVSYGALTTKRTLYNLTHNIAVVDNRGYAKFNKWETGEIFAQLANLVPLNKDVQWPSNYEQMMTKLEQADPNFTDLIVPVFVHRAEKALEEEEMEDIKHFIRTCRNMTGVVPIVVLTHKTEGNVHKLQKIFERLGANQIYKLENYTDKDHFRDRAKDEEILTFLYGAVQDVKYRMKARLDPKKERIERKTFLLKYFHEQEMAKKSERSAIATEEIRRLMKDL